MRRNKLRLFLAVMIMFLLVGPAYPMTVIDVDGPNCLITITLHKEFYLVSPAGIQRIIDSLRHNRADIQRQINELREQIEQFQREFARILPQAVGEDGVGGQAGGQLRVLQEGLDRARASLRRLQNDLQWYDDKLQEYEDVQREDNARRPGLSDADIQNILDSWKQAVEAAWNGRRPYEFNCCRVRFVYEFQLTSPDDPPLEDHDLIAIYISPNFRSNVRGFDEGFDAQGFSNDPFEHIIRGEFSLLDDPNFMPAHEAGHEMGLDDEYEDEVQPDGSIRSVPTAGHENDIMAAWGGTPVSTGAGGHSVDNIAKMLNGRNIRCPAHCCPDFIGPPPPVPPPEPPPEPPPRPPDRPPDMPGPIIVTGCVDNRTVIKIYDAAGRPVATIYEQSVRVNNNVIGDMIKRAKAGAGGHVAGEQLDLSNIGADADSVIVLESDVTDDEINAISDLLRAEMEKRGCRKTGDAIGQAPGVDFTEEIMERDVQADKVNVKVEPNDPFYFDLSRHKEVKGRGKKINTAYGGPLKVGEALIERIVTFTEKRPTPDQWGLHAIGFTPKFDPESAWHLFDASKKNIIVAVIDSGLDLEQPDRPKFLWTNPKEVAGNGRDDDKNGYIDDIHGWNFLDDNNDLTDYKGHGTVVSGIIAAQTNNGAGIAGINPGAQIMVLKVTDEKGKTNNLNIYRALRFAADNGARVINISLGAKGVSKLEQMGISYAFGRGTLIIIATGNQSGDIKEYGPPASRRALTVAAADTKGSRIWFSNIGANVSLVAPGEHIYSLYSKDSPWHGPSFIKKRVCYPSTGTSFSAPIVAGVASLIFAKNPGLTNREVEDILLDSTVDWEFEGWDYYTGAGFLDARKALSKSAMGILTLRFMDLVVNRDKKKKLSSVDLFAIMRGDITSYSISLGKGLKPKKWDVIYESSAPLSSDELYFRIDKELVKRSKDWNVRISAKDRYGNSKIATMPFSVK